MKKTIKEITGCECGTLKEYDGKLIVIGMWSINHQSNTEKCLKCGHVEPRK